MKERGHKRSTEVPPELKNHLRTQEYACLLHGSNRGTLILLQGPASEVATLVGPVTVRLSHELHSKPSAPVIRTILRWDDRPSAQLLFECFTDVTDPQQRDNYRHLAQQSSLRILGYDESLRRVAQKRVTNLLQRQIADIADTADKLRWLIPDNEYDFALAKARVLEQYPLR
jgi:hypothetical protein